MSDVELGYDGIEPLVPNPHGDIMWSESIFETDFDPLWPVDEADLDESFWSLPENVLTQTPLSHPDIVTHCAIHDEYQWDAITTPFTPQTPLENNLDTTTNAPTEGPKDDVPRPKRRGRKPSKQSFDGFETNTKRPKDVERKYRHKLRDHLAELKRTVPTLRAAVEGDEAGVELRGLPAASNSRKPTVLAKTVEYIRHLEKMNRELLAQLEQCGCARKLCTVM